MPHNNTVRSLARVGHALQAARRTCQRYVDWPHATTFAAVLTVGALLTACLVVNINQHDWEAVLYIVICAIWMGSWAMTHAHLTNQTLYQDQDDQDDEPNVHVGMLTHHFESATCPECGGTCRMHIMSFLTEDGALEIGRHPHCAACGAGMDEVDGT